MYFEMKEFNNENMLDDATYDKTIMPIISDTINTAERIISVYLEFISKNISELDFASTVATYFSQINQLYLKLSNSGLPSEKRQNIDGIYMELISAVHDIVLSYIPQNFLKSTPQSRSNVIENRIQKYHIALDNLKNELK